MWSSKYEIYFHVYTAMQWKVGNQLNENLTMMLAILIVKQKPQSLCPNIYITWTCWDVSSSSYADGLFKLIAT